MPYNVQLPNGVLIEGIPDDVSKDEARRRILKQFPDLEPEPTFVERAKTAFKRGVEQLPESLAGITLGAETGLGMTEAAGKKLREIKEEQAKAPAGAPGISFEDLEKIYGKDGAIAALQKLPAYITEQILQSAPSMAVPLAAGAAATPFGGPIVGGLAGIGAYGLQQYGQFMQTQAQGAKTIEDLEPGKAALAAAITAPLGFFVDRLTLGMSRVPTKALGEGIMAELAKRAGATVAGRAATGAAIGVIAEAPTEMLEQMAERWQANLPLFDDAAIREYKEAAAGAAAVGGVGGAASRVLMGRPEEVQPPAAEVPLRAPQAPTPPEIPQITPEVSTLTPPKVEQVPPEVSQVTPLGAPLGGEIREMPGFAGPAGANQQMMEIARQRQAQAEAAAAKENAKRQKQIQAIEAQTFSSDPLADRMTKDRMIASLPQPQAQPLAQPLAVEAQPPAQPPAQPLAQPLAEPPPFIPISKPQERPRGVAAPEFTLGEEEEIKSLRQGLQQVNAQISQAKKQDTGSLFTALKGKLRPIKGGIKLTDIDQDKASLKQLYSKQEGGGRPLEDLVSDGALDDFLPFNNRSTSPGFDDIAAAETIMERLRTGEYKTEAYLEKMRALEEQKGNIKDELDRRLRTPEINKELAGLAGRMRQPAEAVGLDDLIADAQIQGIDVENIKENVFYQNPNATPEQYRGALITALQGAISEKYAVEDYEYSRAEIEDEINANFSEAETSRLIEEAEAEQAATTQPAEKPRAATTTVPVARGAETKSEVVTEESEPPVIDATTEVYRPPQPPVLEKPKGLKLKKGRHEQVVLAARELAAGRITKEQFDQYVDHYRTIGPVLGGEMEAPLEDSVMFDILTKKIRGTKKNPKLVNAPVADGTRVGLRMDLPALDWGRENGVNGSVVSIHEGKNPEEKTIGENISYKSTGHIKNVVFATRDEDRSFSIAQNFEGKKGERTPQQTMEGNWVNTSPEETTRRIKSLLNDPSWTQVSVDPLRHAFFYDRSNRRPVISADEALQVGRFVLAKNVVYGDRDAFKYALISANNQQAEHATAHARAYGGTVVYQNGDIGLVQGFSRLSGDPVYMPFKGEYRVARDIDSISGNPLNLTDQQRQELAAAKQQVIAEDAARTETVVKFNKDGIGFSSDIDPRLAGVLAGWKKMLNISNNVYITTLDDVRKNFRNYTGPYRRIGSAALDPSAAGTMRSLGNGEYYITFEKSTSVGKMLETIAHEFGHIHEKEVFQQASPEMKKAIRDDFNKWLASNKGKTAREHIYGLRAKRFARFAANNTQADMMSADMRSYWHSFDEWYADQVSRWATTQEKPLTIVEQFFAKLGAALKRFYAALRGQKYLPTETFAKYMDEVTQTASRGNNPIATQDQIALFAQAQPMLRFPTKEAPPIRTQTGEDAMEILSGIGRSVEPPEPGYVEKVRESWKNARDNPQATKEQAIGAFRRWADQVETWAFSSDAALNNQIRRAIMESSLGNEEKIGTLLNTSLSQTVHSDAIANLFLMEGNIRWDEEIHKWTGVKSENNIIKLSKQLDELAEKHGLTKEEAELIAHTAFEARRTASLIRENEQIEAQVEAIRAEAARIRAKSPVAASELSDKAAKLLTRKKIIHMTPEQINAGLTQFKLFPNLYQVADTWNGIRENALNVMVNTGLYSPQEADDLLSNADYVPFFREDQIEEGKGPKEFLRSLSVQADKRMKGSMKPVNDIFDNMVRWTQYAVNRGVRNRSALALVDTAAGLQLADRVKSAKDGDNVVRVWRNGKEEFYDMADPMFVSAFRGLESVAIPTIKVFSKVADVLRQSVVLYPGFALAQIPQDSFAAMFTSGLKPQYALRIPVLAAKEFLQTLRGKSKIHEELKNVGAAGVRDFTSAVIRNDAEVLAGLKKDKSFWAGVKRSLGNWAMAADNAVRQATYEAAMQQGLSKAEALEKAFEIFNVRRRGNSKMLAMAGQVIPFFNAYLAAQNVAYRTLTGVGTSPTQREAALKTLAATTGSVMVLSLIYAMMNGDDEDYLKKPTPTRDRLLMIPGTGISLPLRADLFILPKVLAEHTYMMVTDKGFSDSAKFRESMKSLLANAIFSPTPVPQAVKPITEAILNYDFFQQKPLVGVFQQRKELSRQFEDSTSEFARLLGKTEMISPIVADHLIRGMFGSFGGLVLYMTNPAIAAMSGRTRPDISMRDAIATIPNASAFVTKEYDVGLRKDFYALKEVTDRAAATMADLKNRSPQEIKEYLEDPVVKQRLGMAPVINRISNQLTQIRKQVNLITNIEDPKFTDERKEEMIKKLRDQEYELLKNINLKKLREMAQV